MPTISIIIVNWNGREHLDACLRSVFAQTYKDFEVIMVDNGSVDDSVSFVEKNFPDVQIIPLKRNTGFAEGNNVGIREALKNSSIKYIVTLNNDTEVQADWLEQLIRVAQQDDRTGAVASKIKFFFERDKLDSTGDYLLPGTLKVITRGYGDIDKGQYDRIEECFSARAGAALYRREMLEDCELSGDYFDSHFFAYIEDSDLSIRARLRGWKIMYAPQAVVYHKVASTTKKLSYIFRRYHSGRNRLFTAIKDYPASLWLKSMKGRESVDADYRMTIGENILIYTKIIGSLVVSWPRLLRQRRQIRRKRKVGNKEIKGWMEKFVIR
ncbi:MAG: glycosyltransferase family 2 protein [Patescibacteria group bacterium]